MTKFLRYLLVASAPVWAQTLTPVSPTINSSPSREFGQPQLLPSLNSIAPNLVEGRELNEPTAVAFDFSVTPHILYIVDSGNNRILAYKNPASLTPCGAGNITCGFADLAMGQLSLTATLAGGPGSPGLSTGFNSPTAIAVDSKGSVYVADSGNNRIIRFPAPFQQTGSLLVPDLIIGQPSIGSNSPNQGQNLPSAQTLSYNGKVIGLALDPSGNLWTTDPGNNRALRFPVSQLAPNTSQPAADVVLGQTDPTFSSLPAPPAGTQAGLDKNILNAPVGITIDAKGRIYVSDAYSRVLYFPGPIATGVAATRILGVLVQQTPPLPNVNQFALLGPQGMTTNGTNVFICDAGNNRIAEYDIPENWPPEPTVTNNQIPPNSEYSPPIIAVIGQTNLNSGQANQGKPQPAANSLNEPFGVAFNGTDLWVADLSDHRVLDFPQQSSGYSTATLLAGQSNFQYSAPNLIEGREVFFAGDGFPAGAGVVVDQNSNPPHLYIADANNNRILCFKDVRSVTAGSRADLVLGQAGPTDFYDNLINSGTNLATSPTQTGLFGPTGVAVDSAGNLYVADTGNGRVLRFPAPFSQPSGAQVVPNLVLGQQSFTFSDTDATNQNMHSPWGLAIFSDGSLAASDSFHNRILIFKRPTGGDFQNGQVAAVVLGQPNFTTATSSPATATAGLNGPRHIAVDSSDRLYVCDTQNGRVMVFTNARNSANGAASSFQINNLSQPQGIIISQQTGEIYVANTNSDQVLKLPEYDSLITHSSPNSYPIVQSISTQTPPLSVALYSDTADLSDNQIVAEAANRITFFFPQLVYQNSANYNSLPMAPGMLAIMYRSGIQFSLANSPGYPNNLPAPWGPSVNDLEIMVSAPGMTPTPAPIFRIDQTDITFQVPYETPASGTANFVVFHPSTGAIVGEGDFQMAQYSPGFYTAGSPAGTGQVRAFNNWLPSDPACTVGSDGSIPACLINGPSSAIPRDGKHTISFCLTGGGFFPGVQDGVIPTTAPSTADQPQLLSPTFAPSGQVPPAQVTYSGAGCGFPGGWQVNFLVPTLFAPGPSNVIGLLIGDIPSSVGPFGTIQVTFATK